MLTYENGGKTWSSDPLKLKVNFKPWQFGAKNETELLSYFKVWTIVSLYSYKK